MELNTSGFLQLNLLYEWICSEKDSSENDMLILGYFRVGSV